LWSIPFTHSLIHAFTVPRSLFTDHRSPPLPPSHRDHDFNRVAIVERLRRESAAGHDFAIAFERDAFASQGKLIDQLCHVQGAIEGAGLAVDGE
jgi:hypothetical protein